MSFIPAFVRRRFAHRPNLVKIVDNIGWLFFDKVLRLGVGLLVGVWVARYLGPEQLGLLTLALAFTGLFGAIASLGLQAIVVRDILRDPESERLTLGTAAMLQLAGGLLSFLLILGVIAFLRPDDALSRTFVAILGAMMLLKASEMMVCWCELQVLSKYTVWVQNSVFLFFAAVKVGLILFEASLSAFVWAMLAEATMVAVILLLVFTQRGPSITRLQASLGRAKTLLNDSWPLLLSEIAIMFYMKIDQIMLGQIAGNEAVGVYSAATRISEVWYFIIPIVLTSVFPTLAKLHSNKSLELSQRWVQAYRLMFWLSVSVAVTLTFAAKFIVSFLFGEVYSAASIVLTIHVWAGINVAIGSVWSKWLLLENKLIIGLYGQLAGAIINVGLNLLLIPEFGVVGAALATLGSYWISNIIALSLYKPAETFKYIFNAIAIQKRLKK